MISFRLIAVGLLAIAMLGTFGCQSQQRTREEEIAARLEQEMRATENVSRRAIFADLTPELQTLTDRPVDLERRIAVINNTHWRMFWDDWQRALLYDHSSRLSPKPIP